jgi:hypothetical protein
MRSAINPNTTMKMYLTNLNDFDTMYLANFQCIRSDVRDISVESLCTSQELDVAGVRVTKFVMSKNYEVRDGTVSDNTYAG